MKAGSKILITGGSGMLGSSLFFTWQEKADIYLLSRELPAYDQEKSVSVDLTDGQKTLEAVKKISPDIIVHTAAMTNVDYCEDNPEQARAVNVMATENIALATKEIGAKLVYISTDFVFDGKKGNYTEEDVPNPLSVYAKTKWEGEEVVRNILTDWLIIRTTIYGWNILQKSCFPEAVINALSQGKEFTPFEDQYSTPVFTETLADVLWQLLEKNKIGIYNVTCNEILSKYQWAQMVADEFGLDQSSLRPVPFALAILRAPRPVNASLNNAKLLSELGWDKISLKDDIKKMHLRQNFYGQYKKSREKS
ncbi:MAG: dTDP-4-dehydrorhamnose reductase [Patescibacteria group bacterium]|jgi:dTDP-4-dehydrorhamnose reductase